MDTSTIAGTSLLMKAAQTQQAMSMTLMKQAAEQQSQVVNMLAQNARLAPQPAQSTDHNFSTYA